MGKCPMHVLQGPLSMEPLSKAARPTNGQEFVGRRKAKVKVGRVVTYAV